jgi:ankyrin repeat protein
MTFDELRTAIAEDRGVAELHEYLAAGGDVNARDPVSSWTLVRDGCEHLNLPVIRALAEAGADLNALTDYDGWTHLHHAVDIDVDSVSQASSDEQDFRERLTFPTTRLLLSLGADPTIPNDKGETPLDMIMRWGEEVWERFARDAPEVAGMRPREATGPPGGGVGPPG